MRALKEKQSEGCEHGIEDDNGMEKEFGSERAANVIGRNPVGGLHMEGIQHKLKENDSMHEAWSTSWVEFAKELWNTFGIANLQVEAIEDPLALQRGRL
jgi:hypothetical protein